MTHRRDAEMMEAFGGKDFFVENPKDIRGALYEAMNHRGPALVKVVISQGAARKSQAFRRHTDPLHVSRAGPQGAGSFTGRVITISQSL